MIRKDIADIAQQVEHRSVCGKHCKTPDRLKFGSTFVVLDELSTPATGRLKLC